MDATATAAIGLEHVSKRYDDGTVAVQELDLEVPRGELVVLVGPSGCGKSTTLRMVNRLIDPSSGRILLEGEDVTHADPVALRRRIGYVIQQVGLFPHQTVSANVATVPRLLGWDRPRTADRAQPDDRRRGQAEEDRGAEVPSGTGLQGHRQRRQAGP